MVKAKMTPFKWVVAVVVLLMATLRLLETPKIVEPIEPQVPGEVVEPTTPTDKEMTQSEATLKNHESQVPQYLIGKWTIVTHIPTSNIQAHVEKEYLGLEVEYGAKKATIGQTTVLNPRYIVSQITVTDLEDSWRGLKADELKITQEPITQIEIENESGYVAGIGTHLLIRDKDTVLTNWNGVFYQMDRK